MGHPEKPRPEELILERNARSARAAIHEGKARTRDAVRRQWEVHPVATGAAVASAAAASVWATRSPAPGRARGRRAGMIASAIRLGRRQVVRLVLGAIAVGDEP